MPGAELMRLRLCAQVPLLVTRGLSERLTPEAQAARMGLAPVLRRGSVAGYTLPLPLSAEQGSAEAHSAGPSSGTRRMRGCVEPLQLWLLLRLRARACVCLRVCTCECVNAGVFAHVVAHACVCMFWSWCMHDDMDLCPCVSTSWLVSM